MALKNKSMYALLGVLNITPATGYEIKKYCDTVLAGIWNENYGHIYPTLKKLTDEAMIEVLDTDESSTKIRYGITEKGKEELVKWMLAETTLQPARSEYMLKFLFSSQFETEYVLKILRDYRAIYENQRNKYQTFKKSLETGIEEITKKRSVYMTAVLTKAIMSCETNILWCDETMDIIRNAE